MPLDTAMKAVNRLPLMKGAFETFKELKRLGYRLAIISGGIMIQAKRVGKMLGADYVIGSRLEVKDGKTYRRADQSLQKLGQSKLYETLVM